MKGGCGTDGKRVQRKLAGTLLAASVLLSVLSPGASSDYPFPYDPELHTEIVELESWRHPDGLGSDLSFNFSHDHARMVLVGYGAPGEVRVVDASMETLAVLEMPEGGFRVDGARFSSAGKWVAVWGNRTGNATDELLLYDSETYEPEDPLPWAPLLNLTSVDAVNFAANDYIILVAGRAANGTSLLYVLEAPQERPRRVIEVPGNHTVRFMEDDGRRITMVDDSGNVTELGGSNWTIVTIQGTQMDVPTAMYLDIDQPWIMGDSKGLGVLNVGYPRYPEYNVTLGDGPVLGVAWTHGRMWDFMAAVERHGGGTTLGAWQLCDESLHDDLRMMTSLELAGTVTMMAPDPNDPGRVLAAFEDGSLAKYWWNIRPRPPGFLPGQPDVEDGLGLETLMAWERPEGLGEGIRFEFNNAGSLVLFHGTKDGENRFLVMDRAFNQVGSLTLPDDYNMVGYEWSSTDRWLVVWGNDLDDGASRIDLYDAPSLTLNGTADLSWTEGYNHYTRALEFLDGDRVLVTEGPWEGGLQAVCFFNIENRTLMAKFNYTGLEHVDLVCVDGTEVVGIPDQNGSFVRISIGEMRLLRDSGVPMDPPYTHDYHGGTWLLYFLEQRILFDDRSLDNAFTELAFTAQHGILAAAWTHVMAGDLVLDVDRTIYEGSSVHLWRDVDWDDLGSMRLVSVLNTSKYLAQLEADPAYPGVMAGMTCDGFFVLYHVNVTGYPPAPDEIGGIPVNGSIDWEWPVEEPEDGGDQNDTDGGGGTSWGSGAFDLFLVGILVVIVVLGALVVILRRRTGPGVEAGVSGHDDDPDEDA